MLSIEFFTAVLQFAIFSKIQMDQVLKMIYSRRPFTIIGGKLLISLPLKRSHISSSPFCDRLKIAY
jgi:hypothetical protein